MISPFFGSQARTACAYALAALRPGKTDPVLAVGVPSSKPMRKKHSKKNTNQETFLDHFEVCFYNKNKFI